MLNSTTGTAAAGAAGSDADVTDHIREARFRRGQTALVKSASRCDSPAFGVLYEGDAADGGRVTAPAQTGRAAGSSSDE